MALCACKCLNVILECEKFEEVLDIKRLELSSTEQRDTFFSEKLLTCPANQLKVNLVQPALIGHHTVDRMTLESCLACKQNTHAILHHRNIALIPKSILTTLDHINSLKSSDSFSPVFNLLVPEVSNDVEMKENIDTNNQVVIDKNGCSPSLLMIGSLKKQLNQTLQSHLEAIEEAVSQFRDQKYAEYEAYRARAQRDHKILSSIISKAQSDIEKDNSNFTSGPPSPLLPPLQRRRLSSLKDAKKFTQNKSTAQIPHEEDSLEAEDIFDLEGTDSNHYMGSDHDDYDDSDQESNDEGIHIARPRGGAGAADIARSMPISVPKFPSDRQTVRELDDYEEPQDIAESIKALARSVHGDVFELPRPRFSTQI